MTNEPAGTRTDLRNRPLDSSLGNSPPDGAAESGAVGAASGAADPELARVVEAWPRLPAAVRRAILDLIEGAGS